MPYLQWLFQLSKKDQDGNPIRCKYRLVVLGNLDPNNWSKSDCFAPVLSQLELRLLQTIAVISKIVPQKWQTSHKPLSNLSYHHMNNTSSILPLVVYSNPKPSYREWKKGFIFGTAQSIIRMFEVRASVV